MRYLAAFFFLTVSLFINSCKSNSKTNQDVPAVEETDAVKQSSKHEPLVKESKDVGSDQIPTLSVSVNLAECVGTGKWLDPISTDKQQRVGAISVTPTFKKGQINSKPDYWLFQPEPAKSPDPAKTSDSHTWKLVTGIYELQIATFNVTTSNFEFNLNHPVDLSTVNSMNLAIVGLWDASLGCKVEIN